MDKKAATLMFFLAILALTPPIFQRISIAKDTIQVKQSFTYAAITSLVINIAVFFIGILLVADTPHLNPTELVNYLFNNYKSS